MADRAALRAQRLRGAGRELAMDADISFGFGLGAPAAAAANDAALPPTNPIPDSILDQPATATANDANATATSTQTTVANTPRETTSAPVANATTANDNDDEDEDEEIFGSSINSPVPAAAAPAPIQVSPRQDRAAARAARLRGANTRSPPVDFALTLPNASPSAPSLPLIPGNRTLPGQAGGDRAAVRRQRLRGAGRSPEIGEGGFGLDAVMMTGARVGEEQQTPVIEKRKRGRPRKELVSDAPAPGQESAKRRRVSSPMPQMDDSVVRVESSGAPEITPEDQIIDEQSLIDQVAALSSQPTPGSGKRGRGGPRKRTVQEVAEEVGESPADAPGSGKRRKSGAELQLGTPTGAGRRRVVSPTLTDTETARPAVEELQEEEQDETASPIPDARAAAELMARRRDKGKGRADVDLDPTQEELFLSEDSGSEHVPTDDDEEVDEIPATLPKKRGRPPKNKGSPAVQRAPKTKARDRSAAEEDSVLEESTLIEPIQPRKRGRPKGSKNGDVAQPRKTKTIRASGPRSRETIPITAYRLSAPLPPPDDDSASQLPLSHEIPDLKGKQSQMPNSVDVLSQIHDEMLTSALASLENGLEKALSQSSPEEKREYRTKLRAVEAFGEAVRAKLVGLRIAVDEKVRTEERVKAINKERAEKRRRLLEIRRERERVAVRMDAVRQRHEKGVKEENEVRGVMDGLGSVGLAAQIVKERDWEGGGEKGIDERLEEVGKLCGERGLLEKLRAMNGLLERAAEALERR